MDCSPISLVSPCSVLTADPTMIGTSSPGKSYLDSKLPHLKLDEFHKLRVIDHVRLVQEHHDRRNADLTRQQDVLAGLRHRTVRGRHHKNRAVHLRRARDHVLDVVGVTGAVDVRVVPGVRLVLDVRRVDRDAALFLFGSRVDVRVRFGGRFARFGQAQT